MSAIFTVGKGAIKLYHFRFVRGSIQPPVYIPKIFRDFYCVPDSCQCSDDIHFSLLLLPRPCRRTGGRATERRRSLMVPATRGLCHRRQRCVIASAAHEVSHVSPPRAASWRSLPAHVPLPCYRSAASRASAEADRRHPPRRRSQGYTYTITVPAALEASRRSPSRRMLEREQPLVRPKVAWFAPRTSDNRGRVYRSSNKGLCAGRPGYCSRDSSNWHVCLLALRTFVKINCDHPFC